MMDDGTKTKPWAFGVLMRGDVPDKWARGDGQIVYSENGPFPMENRSGPKMKRSAHGVKPAQSPVVQIENNPELSMFTQSDLPYSPFDPQFGDFGHSWGDFA
jgi:hypothetical protein